MLTDETMTVAPVNASHTVPLSKNKHLLKWVEKMAHLTKPASIHWVDGSEEENQALCDLLVAAGTFTKLNQEQWPGCYGAGPEARGGAGVEDCTFICSPWRDNAGQMKNWEDPVQIGRKIKKLLAV